MSEMLRVASCFCMLTSHCIPLHNLYFYRCSQFHDKFRSLSELQADLNQLNENVGYLRLHQNDEDLFVYGLFSHGLFYGAFSLGLNILEWQDY
jgi:hypothetical protein